MKINDIFESADGVFPQEALDLCQDENAYIEELETVDGVRRFQIKPVLAPTQEALFTSLRSQRDALLSATDYAAMPDYPLAADKKAALMTYRQALRDLPSQPGAPWDGGGTETPWPVNPLDA